jgi:hypothetical protein
LVLTIKIASPSYLQLAQVGDPNSYQIVSVATT